METENIDNNLNENKFFIFYKKNKTKILIFLLSLPVILIIFFGYNFYNEKKNTRISNQFNEANILLENDRKQESKKIFISLIDEKHLFYSPLSLNVIVENGLIENQDSLLELFDKILNIKSLDKETKNLYRFKKATIFSDQAKENEMLKTLNPIINSKSIWKENAIKFLEVYFLQKGDFLKAKEYRDLLKQIFL